MSAPPGFHAEPTVAAPRQTSFLSSGLQPTSWPVVSSRPKHARQKFALIALGLFLLFLLLGSVLLLGIALGYHASSSTPTVDATTVATPANPVSTFTPTVRPTATPLAPSCVVNDQAGVLDQDQICQQAQSLSHPLIVNVNNSSDSYVPGDANTIVINIVTTSHHGHAQAQVMITGGSAVPLADDQYHEAEDAFTQSFNNDENETEATIAAIQSLQGNGA